MSQLKWNLFSNFAAKGWIALMSFAFIPVYVRFLGIEAYGLIGFFASLFAIFNLLDLGLSTTLNRELARYSVQLERAQEARNLVRTLEVVYWATGLLIGAIVIGLSPYIAYGWVKADKLSPDTIRQAVSLIGLVVAFQWPLNVYEGGLLGFQRQVLANGIRASVTTLRGVGAILVLWLVSPTIQAFFIWQLCASVLQTAITAFSLWHSLPRSDLRPQFRINVLRTVWRFAGGISAITLVSIILAESDKLVLSRLLPLETFGYYTLAGTVAGSLSLLVAPIFQAIFPTFSKLVAGGHELELRQLYHRGSQLVSVLMLPAAVVLALFSREILLLWTGSVVAAENTYQVTSLLIAGTALSTLMSLPYALQLAYGYTRLAFLLDLIAILFFVPLLLLMTTTYGALGAATAWLLLNIGLVVFDIQLMHRRLLPGEQRRWFVQDVGIPLAVSVAVVMIGRLAIRGEMPPPLLLLGVLTVSATSVLAAALAAPGIREAMFDVLRRGRVALS